MNINIAFFSYFGDRIFRAMLLYFQTEHTHLLKARD